MAVTALPPRPPKSMSLGAAMARVALWPFAAPCEGAHRLPEGAALVVANHSTFLDGLLMARGFAWRQYRPLRVIAYGEPFTHRLFGYMLRRGRCIPLDRLAPDGSRRMLAAALGCLQRGEAVGLFPEGHLTRGPRLGRARPGLGFLALESGAPVVPTGICGGERVWPDRRRWPRWPGWRGRMVWRIGEPMRFADESIRYKNGAGPEERARLLAQVTRAVMREVAALCGREPPD